MVEPNLTRLITAPINIAASVLGAMLGIPGGYEDGLATPAPVLIRRRPYHFTGKIEINGRHYAFGTGGSGRGSIPYGDYPITPDDIGSWGRRHGAIGINHNEIYDPQLHRTREGIEIHAARHLASAGCVAIEEYAEAKHSILHMIAEAGAAFLHIWPGVASITPQRSTGLSVVALNDATEDFKEADNSKRHNRRVNYERHNRAHVAHHHHHLVHYAHHRHHYRHFAKA